MTIQRIGRYELRDSLGSGGAGVVYRAWDPAQGREVALKVLHPRDGGATAQQRFLTECHALARLDHPNIVRVMTGIARAHSRRREFEQAQRVLRRGLEVLPDQPELHRTLGYLTRDTGVARQQPQLLREAIRHLDQALALEPRYATARVERARARLWLANQAKPPSASLMKAVLSDLGQASACLPKDRTVPLLLLEVREALGQEAEAIRVLDKLIEASPTNLKFRVRRGMLRRNSGDLRGALEDLESARAQLEPFEPLHGKISGAIAEIQAKQTD